MESAFPRDDMSHDGSICFQEPGMTLRDYFAAAALTGILANNSCSYPGWNITAAFEHADEMMRKREGR